jgi:hypothetical protein
LVGNDAAAGSDGRLSTHRVNTFTQSPAKNNFPTNSKGLTYGSGAFVTRGDEPDLVAAVGDHGVAGYVLAQDLEPQFQSPEEALAWQKQHPDGLTINVYDASGEKVIDTFTLVAPGVDQK